MASIRPEPGKRRRRKGKKNPRKRYVIKKGDRVGVHTWKSSKGKGLSYPRHYGKLLEDLGSGWDVVDILGDDGVEQGVYSFSVYWLDPRMKRERGENPSRRKSKRQRKNPIAIYNPNGKRLIYGQAFIPEIRGVKTSGPHRGERFKHKFKSLVRVYGLSNGSLLIEGLKSERLWNYDQNL